MTSSTVKHVCIVDDEPTIRVILQKILERAGLKVSCFGTADECLACFDAHGCDLLITDVRLPGKDGMELLTEARRRLPWLPVLVVTGYGDVPMAIKAMKVGAADFLEKPLDRDVFLEAVRDLLARGAAQNALLDRSLTKAEMRVLHLILEGRNNREIADLLHRSTRTVEVHRRHMMQKLGANNIVELLRQAADLHLYGWDSPAEGPASQTGHA